MKRYAILLAAACLAFAGFGANDDAAVANRKWVRAQIATALRTLNTSNHVYTGSMIASTSNSWTYSSQLDTDTNTAVKVKVYTPEYPALFVAWSTTNGVPAYETYAKVPNAMRYANVSNSFIASISYSVTNWVESTNRNGQDRRNVADDIRCRANGVGVDNRSVPVFHHSAHHDHGEAKDRVAWEHSCACGGGTARVPLFAFPVRVCR